MERGTHNGAPVYAVLGATGGIGSELCRRLAGDGARLVIGARDEERLEELAGEVGATARSLDATRMEAVESFVNVAVEEHGRVDGVANCVGSFLLKPAHLTSEEEWSETLALNLNSAFGAVRAAARAMTATGGSVVLMSSSAARVGLSNHEAIAAAKAGVIGLTLSAAASYVSRGIRFNAVAPGLVRTPMTRQITESETSAQASLALHPLGRFGEPEEVAAVIRWLLGSEAGWVTGQVFGIDGGITAVRPLPRRASR
jgi:3-oxoacyl-[acyl-carrier protein] reductase